MTSPVLRVLAASVSIAKRSGSIIRSVLKSGDLGIVEKENKNDLQTEADRAAQRSIVSSLLRQFPDLTIIGEEDGLVDATPDSPILELELSQCEEVLSHQCPAEYDNVQTNELVVWVDPLDGTSEFTQGLLDHVTVLIGIGWKGKSIAGVIHQPYYNYKNSDQELGRTMWGMVGLGTFGCEERKPPAGENIIATTRSHSNKTVVESIEACEPTEVIRVGGAGHKVLLLLDGKVHAYVFASPGCKKWDTCAPEGLLKAMGGKLTDMHGNDLKYDKDIQHKNSAGVLATLNSDHSWYLNKIPESVKAVLNPVLPQSKV